MILNKKSLFLQENIVLNNSGVSTVAYSFKFNWTEQDVTDVNTKNTDILEKILISFSSVSGNVSVLFGSFIVSEFPNNNQFALNLGMNLSSINPIDITQFSFGLDNIYRGYYDILQLDRVENLGMEVRLEPNSSIIGLQLDMTNSIKRRNN